MIGWLTPQPVWIRLIDPETEAGSKLGGS